MAAVLQGTTTLFEIDLFAGAQQRIAELSPVANESPARERARRVIVDAARSALYIGLAGVVPGAGGRGSVIRRLIRRAARHGRALGLEEPFLGNLVEPLIERGEGLFSPEERERAPALAALLTDEERRFTRVLTTGLRLIERMRPDSDGVISGEQLFMLHAERGFPADLAAEVLVERGLRVDWHAFEAAMERHHTISRASEP